MLNDESPAIAEALLARQVQTHRANMLMANVGSAFAAAVCVAMLWGTVQTTALMSWVAVLAAVLGLRAVMGRSGPRAANPAASNRAWLLRFRLGFLAHGMAWGLISALPLPPGDALHQALVVVVLTSVAAGAFTLTAFDLVAALMFGVPALGLLSLRLFAQSEPAYAMLGAGVIGMLAFLSLVARRMQRIVRNHESLRVTEAGVRPTTTARSRIRGFLLEIRPTGTRQYNSKARMS